MEISVHYKEILYLVHDLFKYIFTQLELRYQKDLTIIRSVYPSAPALITDKPLIISWFEAMDMLQKANINVNIYEDLNTITELKLGELVKEKYNSDFFILGILIYINILIYFKLKYIIIKYI